LYLDRFRAAAVGTVSGSGYMFLSDRHHVFSFFIEYNFSARVEGRNCHAQRDGVSETRMDIGYGRFAGANALHPIFHVR
jgi:hypothetical protein